MYEVVVSNIGTVYKGDDILTACEDYTAYVRLCKRLDGRCAGESVVLFQCAEIQAEYVGEKEYDTNGV